MNADKNELKKCPFCGNEADLWYRSTQYGYIGYAECSVCSAKSRAFSVKNPDKCKDGWDQLGFTRAIDAWNRRSE